MSNLRTSAVCTFQSAARISEQTARAARSGSNEANELMSRLVEEPVPEQGADSAFFLDVDGTLLPIAESPDVVVPPMELRRLLARLSSAHGGAMALVSGRPLREIDVMFAPHRFPVAAQHGAEIRDIEGRVTWWESHLPALYAVGLRLRRLADADSRLRLEDKGLAISLHYRRAPHLGGTLATELMEMLAPYSSLRLQPGKCVLEVCAADIGKGRAVDVFMSQPPFAGRRPVYCGDDLTDESGFAAVNALHGLSVKVGPEPTVAQHRLPDPQAVQRWLREQLQQPDREAGR